MKKNRLMKELGVGIAGFALVAPLVLGGMQSSPVHADYQSHDATARYFEKADSRIPKSEKEYDRKLIDRSNASEQRYEQNMIKRDPLATGMYAFEPDNSAKTKALIRKTLIEHPKLFAKDTNMLKKYHVKYRHARRSNHRRARKHVAKRHIAHMHHAKSYGNADQFTSSLMKHSKSYRDAENHESYEQNMDAIDEMPSNPSVVYDTLYDAKNGHHVNKTVLAKAKYWEHKDKANGAWYSPDGRPNKRYAWGRNLKHGRRHHAKKHAVRKHVTRKRSNRRHHAKKNVKHSRRNKRGARR